MLEYDDDRDPVILKLLESKTTGENGSNKSLKSISVGGSSHRESLIPIPVKVGGSKYTGSIGSTMTSSKDDEGEQKHSNELPLKTLQTATPKPDEDSFEESISSTLRSPEENKGTVRSPEYKETDQYIDEDVNEKETFTSKKEYFKNYDVDDSKSDESISDHFEEKKSDYILNRNNDDNDDGNNDDDPTVNSSEHEPLDKSGTNLENLNCEDDDSYDKSRVDDEYNFSAKGVSNISNRGLLSLPNNQPSRNSSALPGMKPLSSSNQRNVIEVESFDINDDVESSSLQKDDNDDDDINEESDSNGISQVRRLSQVVV